MAIACVVLALSACSSEIKGLDRETDAPAVIDEGPATTADPSRDKNEPDPIDVALGDCLEVDYTGVSVRFASVVECAQPHGAQVYQEVVVEEGTLVLIAETCNASLSAALQEPTAGKTYALETPVGYVYNQGLAVAGDQVLCIYVHTEPVTGAF
ncbi:MAG: hypothetical protein CVT64_10970 [Actinobacteria bacterium HGW-Actinobacteria-4]|nr:MAG: hypothetical protein CVT64_10970 [Actinobacteria bacterium HGW-Actinobacteria-4]